MNAPQHIPAPAFSREKQQQALCLAADILESKQPQSRIYFRAHLQPDCSDFQASWRWPGVVRVTVRDTGQLVAESVPGQPRALGNPAPHGQAPAAKTRADFE